MNLAALLAGMDGGHVLRRPGEPRGDFLPFVFEFGPMRAFIAG